MTTTYFYYWGCARYMDDSAQEGFVEFYFKEILSFLGQSCRG